jgi:hypothetical protein
MKVHSGILLVIYRRLQQIASTRIYNTVAEFSIAMAATPAQYTRLISFSPAANKPGELHRTMIIGH